MVEEYTDEETKKAQDDMRQFVMYEFVDDYNNTYLVTGSKEGRYIEVALVLANIDTKNDNIMVIGERGE